MFGLPWFSPIDITLDLAYEKTLDITCPKISPIYKIIKFNNLPKKI
jgi:hypothetical protein